MTKQTRWKCPSCDHGLLAPQRPRRDDIRRYCLPCSSKAGKLVERVAPALESQRDKRSATQRERERKARQVATKRAQPSKARARCDRQRAQMISKEADRIWALMSEWHKGKERPRIVIARGRNRSAQGGHATYWRNHIQVNVDPDQNVIDSKRVWLVLAHELAHCACPPIYGSGKNDNSHHRVFYYCLRHVWQKRWKCEISFAKVSHWGYSVDHIISGQGYKHVDFLLPNPIITEP